MKKKLAKIIKMSVYNKQSHHKLEHWHRNRQCWFYPLESYTDQNVEAGVTYCYGLEDIEYNGKRTFHVDKIISARLN